MSGFFSISCSKTLVKSISLKLQVTAATSDFHWPKLFALLCLLWMFNFPNNEQRHIGEKLVNSLILMSFHMSTNTYVM